jgi:hypothetical protein
MSIPPIVASQSLGKHVPVATSYQMRVCAGLTKKKKTVTLGGSVQPCITARQWLGKYSCGNEELLEVSLSMWSMLYQRKVDD